METEDALVVLAQECAHAFIDGMYNTGSLLSFVFHCGLLFVVVMNWYARNPQIVETEDVLVVLAQECAHAFIDGMWY